MQEVPEANDPVIGTFEFEVFRSGRGGQIALHLLCGPVQCHRTSRPRDLAAFRGRLRNRGQSADSRSAFIRQGPETNRLLGPRSATWTSPT